MCGRVARSRQQRRSSKRMRKSESGRRAAERGRKTGKKAALALSRTKEEKNPCLSALYLLPPLFQQQRQCSPLSAAAAPAARWRRWPARREGERYGDYFFPNVSQSDRRWVLFSHRSRAFCAFCLALLASFSAAICRYDEASGLSAAREDQARDKRGAFARRWNRDEGKRKRRRRPSRKKRCFPPQWISLVLLLRGLSLPLRPASVWITMLVLYGSSSAVNNSLLASSLFPSQ